MKIILKFLLISLPFFALSAGFVNPLGFDGSEEQKGQVLAYIKEHTKASLESLGITDYSTLRIAEEDNLESFKYLTQVNDKQVLQNVINNTCTSLGVCDYSTIKVMYDNEVESKSSTLQW